MYLVDSDWIINLLKGRLDAITLFRLLLGDGMAISIITFAEIYEGIYYGRDQTKHEQAFVSSSAICLYSASIVPLRGAMRWSVVTYGRAASLSRNRTS